MVDANSDSGMVTAKILRETRDFAVEREAELAVEESAVPAIGESAAVEEVPPPAPHPPVDAEAAYRRGRLGVVAALVLVLLFVWIRQLRVSRS